MSGRQHARGDAWPQRVARRLGQWFRAFTTHSPSRFAIVVFASLVLVTTALLSLPIASADRTVTPLADAVFTAVSAVCVTGLTSVDMTSHWSHFGEAVIYGAVNVGGMGALTLASMLGLIISKRMGLRAKLIAAGDTNPLRAHGGAVNESQTVRLGEVGLLLRTVALSTVIIEVVVGLLIYPSMLQKFGWAAALWEAPMYAAMAFTNTGFTLNEGGIGIFADDYFFMTVIMITAFIGSVGFPVLFALSRHLVTPGRAALLRPSTWSLHVKLTLITSGLLLVGGAVSFLALEYDNPHTFGQLDVTDTIFQSFFLSTMTRSGGMTFIDPGELYGSGMVVGSMLMFVGGGSASTAGGIKVTTLAVLALAVWSEARGRQSVQAFGRRIPSDVQRVAVAVLAWGATICAVATIVIAQITHAPIAEVLFDVISAFGTVGLSTGLTEALPDHALYVMGITIFMGRVGTVTLAAAVAATSRTQHYALPVERPIVG
ncbi:potassium transporter Trk [Microbacterium faecale]|uniref:Potassium transporter Trk n=1 Tax=Microbacterium faecale TaxID=1804630 RepID=A0A916YHH0_9MICO|nr:potassium transporter TrkG [Microbacterium faecale]GGD45712.1 potassium transporter Trk [Microbacterium faecale]